jgi:hypothetical protein
VSSARQWKELVHGVEWKHNLPFKDDKDENRSIFATGRITVVVLNIFPNQNDQERGRIAVTSVSLSPERGCSPV